MRPDRHLVVPIFSQHVIFCDKVMGIDRRVHEGALLLSDEKLIAKLSESDMHDIEVKYHANCLCNFYRKLKTIEKQNKDYYENSITYSIVLSEVVNFIKKTLKTSQTAPAFILSDLKQMFLRAYQRYTGTSMDLHSTWLKENFISKIPEFQTHRRGKQVILRTGEVTTEAVLAAL